jgi:hypothetical protein
MATKKRVAVCPNTRRVLQRRGIELMRLVIWWALTFLALLGCVSCAMESCRQTQLLNAMQAERSKILACNLGQAGTYVGAYEEKHGQMGRHFLCLETDLIFTTSEMAEAALRGVLALVTIKDQTQAAVATFELNDKNIIIREYPDKSFRCAWSIEEPVEIGDYLLELKVTQPAAGLGERAQRLEGRYGFGVSDSYRVVKPRGLAQILGLVTAAFFLIAIRESFVCLRSRCWRPASSSEGT